MSEHPVRFFEVDAEFAGQRLDNYLMARLKGVPKSMIYRVIRKGEVRVNKGRAKPDRKLDTGDSIRVPPITTRTTQELTPSESLISTLEQSVLLDEDGLLVINKPSGLAVHGGSGVNIGLIEALRKAYSAPHLELVHRLDRDTSGVIMVARKRSVLKFLQDALRNQGAIQKQYVALVQGQWPKNTTMVDVPLKRCEYPNGERIVRVRDDGKPSQTEFRLLDSNPDCSWIAAKPLTGRTHQIRVHAQHVGCSLIGDEKYTPVEINKVFRAKGFKRLCLHAHSLTLPMPDGSQKHIVAPVPDEFDQPLRALGLTKISPD